MASVSWLGQADDLKDNPKPNMAAPFVAPITTCRLLFVAPQLFRISACRRWSRVACFLRRVPDEL